MAILVEIAAEIYRRNGGRRRCGLCGGVAWAARIMGFRAVFTYRRLPGSRFLIRCDLHCRHPFSEPGFSAGKEIWLSSEARRLKQKKPSISSASSLQPQKPQN